MKKYKIILAAAFTGIAVASVIFSCQKDEPAVDLASGGFPNEVGKIILGKCAVSGCHNDLSKDGAAGLSLASWEKMFEGGKAGACVIPYRPDYSSLLYFCNTFPEFGLQVEPRMPLNREALSYDEVKTLNDWIAAGAPDRNGKIKFAENPNRRKLYVTCQGCDEVAVIDAQTKLVMRYIHVGATGQVESPHMIKISPDGQYWYVCFSATGTVLQKYRTSDDGFEGQIIIGPGGWNTFAISSDSRYGFVSDWASGSGMVKYVDLNTMTLIASWGGVTPYGHGTAIDQTSTNVYVGANYSNRIYKIPVSNPGNETDVVISSTICKPHDILFSPDGTKYFITCEGSDEVRIMRTSDDALLDSIQTGTKPLEMSVSLTQPYLFVTCEEDSSLYAPGSGKKGFVTIINYLTNAFVANIDCGTYQPHGIAVDDVNGVVYVASRNISYSGPAPHHTGNCAGRLGFITLIDLNTLQRLGTYRTELSVDPYSIAIRP